MKKPRLTSLLTAATLFLVLGAAGARAQEAATPPPPAPPATGEAAEQSLRQRLEKDPRFLARADTDHDGKISDAEWAAARDRFKAMRDQRGPGFAGRPDDRRDPAFRRGYLLGKYDKNGDGRLDETERAAMRADMEARLRRHMEKELARLKAIDTDGDGKISEHYTVQGMDTGYERFNPEWLFMVPGQIEGPVMVRGEGVISFALTNVKEAYGLELEYLKDSDGDGFPDVIDPAPHQTGYRDGIR